MLTDYQMYKRDYLASGAPRVGLLSCAQFKRAEERREHEESTLPARYALPDQSAQGRVPSSTHGQHEVNPGRTFSPTAGGR